MKNWNRLTACALALIMSAGMTVTPALAEEATPEAAAPAETVAVDAPTFYANSHDVKAVVMNIGAAQDSVNVTWYGSTPTGGMLKYGVQGGEMTTLQAAVAPTSSEGWYKNTVTLTGLQSNTTYEYAVSADKDEAHYGETKTYTTQTFGKDEPYTFLVFGDPQIGCSGSIDDDNGGGRCCSRSHGCPARLPAAAGSAAGRSGSRHTLLPPGSGCWCRTYNRR